MTLIELVDGWLPVVVIRQSGKACLCYHPWSTDEGCHCDLPS